MPKILIYIAGDNQSHKRLGEELRKLPEGEYVIKINKNRPIRSISANNFFWAIIQLYATHTGHTSKEIDNLFRMDRFFEIIEYPKSGKREKIPKETHDLNTAEFAAVCNNLLQWGRENFPEIIVPRKEDLTYAQWMQIQTDYEKVHSGF